MALLGFDAFSPREVADRVEAVGVAKARLPASATLVLAVLAGAFIGFGALSYTLVASDPQLGFAATRLLGGLVFSLGLVLVIIGGAELFTGNNLLVMAWADGRIPLSSMLRNWSLAYAGNLLGAIGLALLVFWSRHWESGDIGAEAVAIAAAKQGQPAAVAFVRGVLCNTLVCLAVWMSMAGRSVIDRVVVIVFPVTAFVAAGFEHSVANFYFYALALLLAEDPARAATIPGAAGIDALRCATQLGWVTAGNIFGGGGFVATVYWLVYRRALGPPAATPTSRD